jgi:hypothetical protein
VGNHPERLTVMRRMPSALLDARAAQLKPPLWRLLLIDTGGQRIGRFETDRIGWTAGNVFELDGERWRISRYLSAHSLDAILTDYKNDNNREEARELTAA